MEKSYFMNPHGSKNEKNHFLTVAVLNYNGKKFLKTCFDSIINNSNLQESYDICLIDNNSRDDSVEFVKTNYPKIKIISLKKNYGFSRAYNYACKRLNSEYIFFLNNDTRLEDDCLSELLKFTKIKNYPILGSKMLSWDGKKIDNAGTSMSIFGQFMDIGKFHVDERQYDYIKHTLAACGGAMLVNRKYFLSIGGFSPLLENYYEDVDLCIRSLLFGKKVLFIPSSIVYHKYQASWAKQPLLKRKFVIRNALFVIFINFELKNLIPLSLMNLSMIFFSIIYCAFTKKSNLHIKASFQAISEFIKQFRTVIYFRKKVQSNRIISDSIILQYRSSSLNDLKQLIQRI